MAEDTLHFFKRNVHYTIGIRNFIGDKDGLVLNAERNVVEVKEKDLKNFKVANKAAILDGLIKEIEEPIITWETANALSDEEIADLLKNYLKLKSAVTTIDSLPILYKMREAAKEKDVSKKTLSLITSKIDELEPDNDIIMRGDMQGVE
jgi:hypothetical protein